MASVVVAVCHLWTVQAQAGPYFPIKRENLYDGYRESVDPACVNPKDLSQDQWENCMRKNVLSVDYTCRYSVFHYQCYCCGAFFHYIEQGKVCTKYCLKLPEEPQTQCQPHVIILPFNYGDNHPEKITLDGHKGRGSQVPIPFQPSPACPTDPFIPDECYGPRDVPLSAYWDPSGQSRNVSRERPQHCSKPAPLTLPSRSNNRVEHPTPPIKNKPTNTRRTTPPTTTARATTTTARATTKRTTTRRATTIIPQGPTTPTSRPVTKTSIPPETVWGTTHSDTTGEQGSTNTETVVGPDHSGHFDRARQFKSAAEVVIPRSNDD